MAWAHGALPWLGALVLGALLLLALMYWPVRFELSGRARGEADGLWLLAGGASHGLLALTFVWASCVPGQVTVLLFGRKAGGLAAWSRRRAAQGGLRMRRRTSKKEPGRSGLDPL